MANDHSSHVLVVTGTVPPASSAQSREIGRFVMESSECSEYKSERRMGIIDLFCAASSDWWTNYINLLVEIGLKHEIDETQEAERYKSGDGKTLVSSIRVTAPIVVGQQKKNCLQRGPFETLALVDRCQSVEQKVILVKERNCISARSQTR